MSLLLLASEAQICLKIENDGEKKKARENEDEEGEREKRLKEVKEENLVIEKSWVKT